MYKQSEDFNTAILGDNRIFYTKLVFGENELIGAVKNVKKYSQVTSGDVFSIGGAISSYVTMDIWQPEFSVEGNEFELQIGIETEYGPEWCKIGKFTAGTPRTSVDGMITVTAYDRIQSKLAGPYFSELTYPTDAKNILNEISVMTGVPIITDNLETGVVINQAIVSVESDIDDEGNQTTNTTYGNPFDGYSYREALGYLAMLFCKYAITDGDGSIKFVWYENNGYQLSEDRYYNDYTTGEVVFMVGSISCITPSGELVSGSGTGNVQLENPVMTQERLDYIYNQSKDLQFIPVSLSFFGDIRVEPGDILSMTKSDGMIYTIPVMNIVQDFDGGLKTTVYSYGGVEQENTLKGPTITKLERQYAELFLVKELIARKANFDYVYALSGEFRVLKAETGEFVNVVTQNLNAVNADIKNLKANNITTENLNAALANIGVLTVETADLKYATIDSLKVVDAKFENLKADFLDVKLSNIDTANIDKAVIATMFVELGLINTAVIENGHITGYLDSVSINANAIKAGTLSVDRLVINGSKESLIFALNNAGELVSTSVDTLDGGLLTDRTITADKLVAHSITANEITTSNIVGASGWINLAEGTFNYGNQLIWDGDKLTIKADSIESVAGGNYVTQEDVSNMRIGARNLVRNSKTLNFDDYYFGKYSLPGYNILDEEGNVLIDENGLALVTVENGGVE